MIGKDILKQVMLDNRKDVESYSIIHRDINTGGFDCCVFVGVRRAGKSFALFEQIQMLLQSGHSWNEMLYLSFEDERLSEFEVSDFNKIIECHIEQGGVEKPMLFLDEIQVVEGWEKFARRMADSKHKLWITGSNAKMLSKEIMTTLGGRFLTVEVFPFSFTEYLRSKGVGCDSNVLCSTVGKSNMMRVYGEYLRWGGLPENVNNAVKRNYLSSIFQKIYLGDICARNRIGNPNLLRLLIKKMSESVKQPVSYSRITKVLSSAGAKLSIPTTIGYIGLCEDAWLVLRLHNIAAAFSEKETVSKYYFIDNGLISLLQVDPGTTLLENLVALSLFRQYGHDLNNERVFFYNSAIEVDFYIPEDELAIQVSYSINDEETRKREVGALTKISKVFRCSKRVVITYDEESHIEDEYGGIDVIPCWKWMLEHSL